MGMMAKFLEQVKTLGFDTCHREPGTWKVTAAWSLPGSDGTPSKAKAEEPPAKKSKIYRFVACICLLESSMSACECSLVLETVDKYSVWTGDAQLFAVVAVVGTHD